MSSTNCPNCGAAKKVGEVHCQFCGTPSLDLSTIDLISREPFFLTMRVPVGAGEAIITQKVRPNLDCSMTMECDTCDVCDALGYTVASVTRKNVVTTNLTFDAVPMDNNGALITMIVKGD